MKISVIIPNYNGLHLLRKNLPSVISIVKSYLDSSIIIVDDHSEDSEIDALVEYVKELNNKYDIAIKLILNDRNLGFASTINKGIEEANGDTLLLLNSDALPDKGFLEPILNSFSQTDNLFGVGCMDKSMEDGKVVLRGRGIGKWKKGFLMHAKGEVNKSDTLWISGGSSAVSADIVKKLGGFDSLYNPFYWEDIDLSYRALKSGYKILFEKKSAVTHYHEEGAIISHYTPYEISTISYRNQFIFVWKNITDFSLIFSHILWLPYHFLSAVKRGDTAFFKGFFGALFKIPTIISHRMKQKEQYVRSDSDILSFYEIA